MFVMTLYEVPKKTLTLLVKIEMPLANRVLMAGGVNSDLEIPIKSQVNFGACLNTKIYPKSQRSPQFYDRSQTDRSLHS